MAYDVDRALAELLRGRVRAEGWTWLEQELGWLAEGQGDLAVAFASAGRHVGRGGLDVPGATVTTAAGETIPLAAWRVDDVARVRLLLAAARHAPTTALERARELYFGGDARERAGALRALSLLPGADDDPVALPAVLDALRTNQGEIFEAAILDNPYASRHLPQLEWRKAALKALFLGWSIRRVARLEQRADAELAQSLVDLAAEREAANRVVSPDTWPLAAKYPPPGLVGKLVGYLEHSNRDHRLAAAQALALLAPNDPRVVPFVLDRADREPDAAVRDVLRTVKA
ncbi:MAG TPA: EboA domain-containing protein [Kofleriaceae bacterium]|nr:EboA domain-containing protein [Kofleriaceae bacterium]